MASRLDVNVVLGVLLRAVEDAFDLPAGSVAGDAPVGSLDLDSLGFTSAIVQVEDELDVHVDQGGLALVEETWTSGGTFAELAAKLHAHLGDPGAREDLSS